MTVINLRATPIVVVVSGLRCSIISRRISYKFEGESGMGSRADQQAASCQRTYLDWPASIREFRWQNQPFGSLRITFWLLGIERWTGGVSNTK